MTVSSIFAPTSGPRLRASSAYKPCFLLGDNDSPSPAGMGAIFPSPNHERRFLSFPSLVTSYIAYRLTIRFHARYRTGADGLLLTSTGAGFGLPGTNR